MSWAQNKTNNRYNQKETLSVQEGLAQHEATTQSSANAARIALETRDTAKATLGELEKQGQQIERINIDLDTANEDQQEAKSLLRNLRWMRRCCCCLTIFSCCGDCDPNSRRDDTRKMRVRQRQHDRRADSASRAQDAELVKGQNAGPISQVQMQEQQARGNQRRQELFNGQQPPPLPALRGGPHGNGLQKDDAEAVRHGTATQDDNIRVVESAANDIKRLAYAIEDEVSRQAPLVDATTSRVSETRGNVRESARQAYNYRTGR